MKTKFTLIAWLISCCAIIFNLPANAQFTHFPTYDAPIFGQANVSHGNLDDLDQKTSPIWFKVNGNIVGPQPHNKMHPYVTAGSQVQVNFNINKNVSNRYSMVTYTVSDLGVRKMYDYHSDHFNQIPPSPPVQGNSNQQLVLVPTCRFEIYFVKGTIALEWNGPAPSATPYDPTTDLANPYTNDLGNVIPAGLDNRIIDWAYGGPDKECDNCPSVVVPAGRECVYPRLLEVIDIPGSNPPATGQKELIFSVANTVNTATNQCFQSTVNGQLVSTYPEIGDVMFTNLFPVHTSNNQPYFFRWNYQLGPFIQNYSTKGTLLPSLPNIFGIGPNYQGAFVFDQRNNHANWDYRVYQSDIYRYKVSYAEYARLSAIDVNDPLASVPQICIELSPKHPEPHLTLDPVFCFNLQFDCVPTEECPPPTITECTYEDCCVSMAFAGSPGGSALGYTRLLFDLAYLNGSECQLGAIDEISFEFTQAGSLPSDVTDATLTAANYTFSINGNTITYVPNVVFTSDGLAFDVPDAFVQSAAGQEIKVTMSSGAQDVSHTFMLEVQTDPEGEVVTDCGIIVPLPVELVSFTGAPSGNGIDLKWNTASEKNNDHFDVERSADGKNFEKIGVQKGNGNTSVAHEYKFLDKHPMKGLNYYRLRQVDFDGGSTFTQIIKVTAEKGTLSFGVKLIPNPCSNENCSVLLQGVDASKALVVEMKDLTGRTVFRQDVPADQQSFNLPKANLGKGVYVLSAKNGQFVTYQKVIIQ